MYLITVNKIKKISDQGCFEKQNARLSIIFLLLLFNSKDEENRRLIEEKERLKKEEEEKIVEAQFTKEEAIKRQIQQALNEQTYDQFRKYADQQFPGTSRKIV